MNRPYNARAVIERTAVGGTEPWNGGTEPSNRPYNDFPIPGSELLSS